MSSVNANIPSANSQRCIPKWWENKVWGPLYYTTHGRRRAKFFGRFIYFYNQQNLQQMIMKHPADVVVSVHSVVTRPSMYAYRSFNRRPPFITVVTDFVETPYYWYDRHVEQCFVPTNVAYERGLKMGLRPQQMQVTGLPVNPHFTDNMVDREQARRELGWTHDLPTVMLIAGSEGIGNLFETATTIDKQVKGCHLAIIAGRNQEIRAELESYSWRNPHHIYGFVSNHDEMPKLMTASHILVTKAGPGTINEAFLTGIPMIINSAIPGQEDGNAEFVEDNYAGIKVTKPKAVAKVVQDWLIDHPEKRERYATNSLKLARPNAVWDIADAVWGVVRTSPNYQQKATLYPSALACC